MRFPTPSDIKDNYLFGIPLTDDSGNEFSELAFQNYIDIAVDFIETELQIRVKPTDVVNEIHDYHIEEYMSFAFMSLYQYPVISVSSVTATYAGQDLISFPQDWLRVYKDSGQVHIIPTSGSLASLLLGRGSGIMLPLLTGTLSYMPALFRVNYQAGFEAGRIPPKIYDIICMKACMGILNVLGDILLGAGIASESISLDGLSQSVGTTQSAEYGAYSARVTMYDKQIKRELPTLKEYYKGLRLIGV